MFTDHPDTVPATRSRWRFWLLVIGAPLLGLVLSGVVWVLRTSSALASAIAEADRLDPRWRLEEIQADRANPPQGQNGANRIAATQMLLPKKWADPAKTDLLDDLPSQNRLNGQQIAALKDLLGPLGPALAEARSLVETPTGRHPIIYAPNWIDTLLPTVQPVRETATLLRFDVCDKAEAGDLDGAVRSTHAIFHAGTSIGDEPILVAQLVRIAVQAIAINQLERVLAQGEPTDTVLAALQARFEAAEPAPLWLYGLRGERAGFDLLFENLRNGTVPIASPTAGKQGPPALDEALLRLPGALTAQQAAHLRYMNGLVEVAKLPPEQWSGPLTAQEATMGTLPGLVRVFVGPYGKIADAGKRNHALLRCAIVAIASERYRRAKGDWPATPHNLVEAGLLKAVPVDPYLAGQPIRFARPGDGLIVYTVSQDGNDDGGKLDKNPSKAGADFGFRLWNVAARRQPPLPPKPAETPP